VTEPSHAVFLSYASQDAEAAKHICEALRAAGIEVWFDQSELRGGDAWDRQIRKQIHDCALFIPIISSHSDARREGYFRLEWKLAVDRTHTMSDRAPFLVPLVIDDTSDSRADVPAFARCSGRACPQGQRPRPLLSVCSVSCQARHRPRPGCTQPRGQYRQSEDGHRYPGGRGARCPRPP
jgi:hypothetical protein